MIIEIADRSSSLTIILSEAEWVIFARLQAEDPYRLQRLIAGHLQACQETYAEEDKQAVQEAMEDPEQRAVLLSRVQDMKAERVSRAELKG